MNVFSKWIELEKYYQEKQKGLALIVKKHGLELNSFYVLYYLNEAPEQALKLNNLEDVINLSQSALSRLITRLENSSCGVIERTACITDNRCIYLTITDKGKKMLEETMLDINKWLVIRKEL
ncbi:hypothetical protein IGJ83_003442 [Enterococcus pernyi]